MALVAELPLGGLLVCVLMTSKDFRFVLPLLPQLGLALGVVTAQTAARARPWIRPWQAALAAVALSGLLSNHFGLGPNLTGFAPHPPRGERGWPVEAIVATIRAQSPHQLSTLAVLPDSEFLNAFILDAEGRRQQFKVAARQTLAPVDQLQDDLAGFDWFLLKGGNQGVMSDERQARLTELVAHSAAFERAGQWPLPDGSRADLYRRRQLSLEVEPIDWPAGQIPRLVASLQAPAPERLEPRAPAPAPNTGSDTSAATDIQKPTGGGAGPEAFRPGESLELTLELQGPSQQLATGVLLLEWRPRAASAPGKGVADAASPRARGIGGAGASVGTAPTSWRADHAIGQGMVRARAPGDTPLGQPTPGGLHILEQLALQLPAQLAPGPYQLQAQLLTPTGQILPLTVTSPPVQVEAGTSDPRATPPLAANRITVLHQLGQQLRAGQFDPLFARVGQLNQTDPDQVYLRDGAAISAARLRQDPSNLDDLYALALAQALQRQADGAATTLARILPLDPTNPNALLGLGIVDLYRFKPWAAEKPLLMASKLSPSDPTIKLLLTVQKVMSGRPGVLLEK